MGIEFERNFHINIMFFNDAPKDIQDLSPHGGDEDYAIIVRKDFFDHERNFDRISYFVYMIDRLDSDFEDPKNWMDHVVDGCEYKIYITAHA